VFKKKSQIIGIDIGSYSVKVAVIEERDKELVMTKFGIKELPPEVIVDGTIMDQSQVVSAINGLTQGMNLKSNDVCMSVSGHSVIIKKISLPEMSAEELSESITWEAEQYIPFSIDEVNLDFQILGPSNQEGANTMDVILVAAKKDKINDYVTLVVESGLNPQIMDVDAFALENMFEVNYGIETGRVDALVNIGAQVLNINVLKDGVSAFTRDSSVGGKMYSETLQKDLGVSLDAAEQLLRGQEAGGASIEQAQQIISNVNDDIVSEIGRTLDFFRATTGIESVDRILLCGGTAMVGGIVDLINERLDVPVEVVNPFRNIQLDSSIDADLVKKNSPALAVVAGLALRRVGY
jgi:type IV pilus assembly protein PilM